MNAEKYALYDSVVADFNAGDLPEKIARGRSISSRTVRTVLQFLAQARSHIPFNENQVAYNRTLVSWAESRAENSGSSSEPSAVPVIRPSLHTRNDELAFLFYDRVYSSFLAGSSRESIAKEFGVSKSFVRKLVNTRKNIQADVDALIPASMARMARWAKLRAPCSDTSASLFPSSGVNTELVSLTTPKLSDEKQALFLALLLSELFYLAASGNTSLPFPPTNYDGQQTDCLGFRMGGIRTAVYAMDYEDEYLKWRKSVLGDYDIAKSLKEAAP